MGKFARAMRVALDYYEQQELDRPDNITPFPGQAKRKLTEEDIEGFNKAADSRDIWHDIDALIKEIARYSPMRAMHVRREIKWLRKQAYKRGRSWGLK